MRIWTWISRTHIKNLNMVTWASNPSSRGWGQIDLWGLAGQQFSILGEFRPVEDPVSKNNTDHTRGATTKIILWPTYTCMQAGTHTHIFMCTYTYMNIQHKNQILKLATDMENITCSLPSQGAPESLPFARGSSHSAFIQSCIYLSLSFILTPGLPLFWPSLARAPIFKLRRALKKGWTFCLFEEVSRLD